MAHFCLEKFTTFCSSKAELLSIFDPVMKISCFYGPGPQGGDLGATHAPSCNWIASDNKSKTSHFHCTQRVKKYKDKDIQVKTKTSISKTTKAIT